MPLRVPLVVCTVAPMWLRVVILLLVACTADAAERVAAPAGGKLDEGLYFDEPAKGHDPTEHDIKPEDVARFEKAIGKSVQRAFWSNSTFVP